jgi:hypothetical protein
MKDGRKKNGFSRQLGIQVFFQSSLSKDSLQFAMVFSFRGQKINHLTFYLGIQIANYVPVSRQPARPNWSQVASVLKNGLTNLWLDAFKQLTNSGFRYFADRVILHLSASSSVREVNVYFFRWISKRDQQMRELRPIVSKNLEFDISTLPYLEGKLTDLKPIYRRDIFTIHRSTRPCLAPDSADLRWTNPAFRFFT